jgi:hypothetical protein
MSIGRVGARTLAVSVGVLAALALMAGSASAALKGHKHEAYLCKPGGYPGVLFNATTGQRFRSVRQCEHFAGKDLVMGLDATAHDNGNGTFSVTCTGLEVDFGEGICVDGLVERGGEFAEGPYGGESWTLTTAYWNYCGATVEVLAVDEKQQTLYGPIAIFAEFLVKGVC